MLNTDLKVGKKEKMTYPPLPEDIYEVELLDITSEEKATYDTRNAPEGEKEFETVMSFQFTLLEGEDKGEKLRGRNVWQNFVPTYLYIGKKGKNNLYQIIEALLGRDLSPQEEAEGIDGNFLNNLIGKHCRVGIKHKVSGDNVYDNIDSYYKSRGTAAALSSEEREKAQVKKETTLPSKEHDINPDDIPFD